MIRLSKLFAVALVAAMPASGAFGHGFSPTLTGNALNGISSDWPGNGNQHLFIEQFNPVGSDLITDHGGYGQLLFGSGKSLSFDVHSALYYSDGSGSPAIPAPAGITLLIEDQQSGFVGPSAVVDGTSTFVGGFPISGNSTHEFLWTLQGATIPEGVYGLAYIVNGSPVGGSPYGPTPLLVPMWMTPSFFPGDDPFAPNSPFNLAQAAIYEAATNPVPEPSTTVLLGLGFAGLAVPCWRRRLRARCMAT
jgi:hypothetical protein